MGQAKMNKIGNVVYSGWLIKSPPERKTTWKIFRAKWKRRFFVLFKPSGSLPGQYELSYFNDEQCTKKKGSIDLDQCEQIIESLDSDQFNYLLAIKTYCRGKERTYFLAADSEEDMTAWVRNLCGACDLKQEESPTDIPPESQKKPSTSSSVMGTSPPSVVSSNGNAYHITTNQPVSINASMRSPPPPSHVSSAASYIPLNTCRSGSKKQRETLAHERRESVDSVPEELAPPPPDKGGKSQVRDSQEDNVFQDVYDVPPPSAHGPTDLYQVPPRRPYGGGQVEDLNHGLAYDVPPRRGSPSTPRSSGSDKTSMGRPVTPQDLQPTYDTPPPRPNSSGSGSGSGSNTEQAPVRPPKPVSMNPTVYMNVPKNSKSYNNVDLSAVPSAPKPPERPLMTESYDVPRSGSIGSRTSALTVAPPAPKSCSMRTVHKYINAGEGVMEAPRTDSTYVPMDKSEPERETVYTDMDAVYTDMRMSEQRLSNLSSIYQSPPPCRVPPRGHTASAIRAPPCPNPGHNHKHQHRHHHHHHHLPQHLCPDSDTYQNQIWSSQRTKSFKRNEQNRVQNHNSPISVKKSLPVTKPPLQLPSKYDTVSSSDEEDGDDTGVHLPPGMRAVPPPPLPEDKELKYLDLELEECPPEPNTRSPSSIHIPHSTPTEYREIDFVKTQALSNTKKWKDEHMRHDEH